MQAQKEWNKPKLTSFGSIEAITEQVDVNVDKTVGSGDTVVLTITNPVTGTVTTINVPDPNNGAPSPGI